MGKKGPGIPAHSARLVEVVTIFRTSPVALILTFPDLGK